MSTGIFPANSGGGGGLATIPELTSDPSSPSAEEVWVLRSGSLSGGGSPIGLLLALTYSGTGSYTYQLSYYTNEGTTIRTTLS